MGTLDELYPDSKKDRYCVGLVIIILLAFLLFFGTFLGKSNPSTDTSSSTPESSAPAKEADTGGYTVPERYTPPKYEVPQRNN